MYHRRGARRRTLMLLRAMAQRGGGGRGSNKRGRGRDDDPDVRCSKSMSKLLRHSPPAGTMDAQGWMALPVLLQHLRGGATEEQVRRVVDSNDKKRFVLDDSTDPPRIRAAQGHTVQLEDPVLDPVLDAATVPWAVHVTSHSSWKAIQESGQLLRMKRTHIHFATRPHHMRANSWAQVFLRLDLQAALDDGHKFFLSSNEVLLCEGPLPVRFMTQLQRRDLPDDWGSAVGAEAAVGAGAGAGASSQQQQQQQQQQREQQQEATGAGG